VDAYNPGAGSYNVYVWWTSHTNRSTAVPISVTHAGGTTTKTYNQQTGGGQWVLHGTYNFNAGTPLRPGLRCQRPGVRRRGPL